MANSYLSCSRTQRSDSSRCANCSLDGICFSRYRPDEDFDHTADGDDSGRRRTHLENLIRSYARTRELFAFDSWDQGTRMGGYFLNSTHLDNPCRCLAVDAFLNSARSRWTEGFAVRAVRISENRWRQFNPALLLRNASTAEEYALRPYSLSKHRYCQSFRYNLRYHGWRAGCRNSNGDILRLSSRLWLVQSQLRIDNCIGNTAICHCSDGSLYQKNRGSQ